MIGTSLVTTRLQTVWKTKFYAQNRGRKIRSFHLSGWRGRAPRWHGYAITLWHGWHNRVYRWHDRAHPYVWKTSYFSSYYEFLSISMSLKHVKLIDWSVNEYWWWIKLGFNLIICCEIMKNRTLKKNRRTLTNYGFS